VRRAKRSVLRNDSSSTGDFCVSSRYLWKKCSIWHVCLQCFLVLRREKDVRKIHVADVGSDSIAYNEAQNHRSHQEHGDKCAKNAVNLEINDKLVCVQARVCSGRTGNSCFSHESITIATRLKLAQTHHPCVRSCSKTTFI
jgi:hypothetical protein